MKNSYSSQYEKDYARMRDEAFLELKKNKKKDEEWYRNQYKEELKYREEWEEEEITE